MITNPYPRQNNLIKSFRTVLKRAQEIKQLKTTAIIALYTKQLNTSPKIDLFTYGDTHQYKSKTKPFQKATASI